MVTHLTESICSHHLREDCPSTQHDPGPGYAFLALRGAGMHKSKKLGAHWAAVCEQHTCSFCTVVLAHSHLSLIMQFPLLWVKIVIERNHGIDISEGGQVEGMGRLIFKNLWTILRFDFLRPGQVTVTVCDCFLS